MKIVWFEVVDAKIKQNFGFFIYLRHVKKISGLVILFSIGFGKTQRGSVEESDERDFLRRTFKRRRLT